MKTNQITIQGFDDVYAIDYNPKKPLKLIDITNIIFNLNKVNKKDTKDKYGLVKEDYAYILQGGEEEEFIKDEDLKPGVKISLRALNY